MQNAAATRVVFNTRYVPSTVLGVPARRADHKYTESNLRFEHLKGADRAMARLLSTCSGFDAHLVLVTRTVSGEAGDPYNPYNYFKRHRCPYSDYDYDSDDFGEDESEEESEDEICYGSGHTMGMVGAKYLLVECLAVPALWIVKVEVLPFSSNTPTVHA